MTMLRIVPKASNAFVVQFVAWRNNQYVVLGELDMLSTGDQLHIINREGDIKVTQEKTKLDMTHSADKKETIVHNITLQPVERFEP